MGGSRREGEGSRAACLRLSRESPRRSSGRTVASPILLCGIFATALLLPMAATAAAETPQSKLKQSAEELERIRQRMQAVNDSIDTDKGQQDELRDAVEAAERKVGDAQRTLRRLAAQVAEQEGKVRAAQASHAAAEKRLSQQRELLARQLRAAYVIGQTGGRTAVFLNQDEPDRIVRMLSYYDYLNRARAETITHIGEEIKKVEAEQKAFEVQLAALKDLQSQHKRAVVELDSNRAARARAVAQVNARIRDETAEMSRLKGNEKQLQALLEKLKQAVAEPAPQRGARESTKATPTMRGRHEWPLRGPILANYGDPKAGGKLLWKGLWIGAQEGAPVKATAAGRVAYVGWLSSYGLIVVLEHPGGYFTLYGHNATVIANTGENVDEGEVIAAAGNTGGYEQTGLYFEVRRGSDPTDPTNWLMR